MTKEELREHCERQIQQFEQVEKIMPVTPNDWKRYEEHKLILDLLEQEQGDRNVKALDIEELPPVIPQPRWIPVSEKLPNDRDWYLGIFKEPDTGWINPVPFICDYVGSETKATTKEYWILRGFTDRDERIEDYYFNLECVKWMPLPSTYIGGEET